MDRQTLILVGISFLVIFLVFLILKYKLKTLYNSKLQAFAMAARLPLVIFVVIFFCSVVWQYFIPATWQQSTHWVTTQTNINIFLDILKILVLYWLLYRLLVTAESRSLLRSKDKSMTMLTTQIFKILLLVIVAISIANIVGLKTSGFLAFGGASGLVAGFATKDLLANFLSGFILYVEKPFKVGDWIRSPDRDIEGTVERVGWRLTQIRTFDKRILFVPNAIFQTISLENPSRMTHRRIYETFGIRYEDAGEIAVILQEIRAMVQNHPDLEQTEIAMINLITLSKDSFEIMLYVFTKTTDWATFHSVKEDVLLKIVNIVVKHGAEVALRTQTLHLDKGTAAKIDLEK